MTRLHNEKLLEEARRCASALLHSLDHRDHPAEQLAAKLAGLGIASLEALSPRGTLEFAAPSRLVGSEAIGDLVAKLDSRRIPDDLWPACCDVLAVWAGAEAVPVIARFLKRVYRSPENPARSRSLQHGLSALHMIGGSEAARFLTQLQQAKNRFGDVRDQASWYLNQLGERMIDPMFGAEACEPTSSEEVAIRDSLWDPYRWEKAYDSLMPVLWKFCSTAWKELGESARTAVPMTKTFDEHFRHPQWPVYPWSQVPDSEVGACEDLILAAIIRLSDVHLLVLDGASDFFSGEDVETSRECRAPSDWQAVSLRPTSPSVSYMSRLSLPNVPAGHETWEKAVEGEIDSPDVQGVFRSWANRLPAIGQDCNRRGVPVLTFALAVLHDHLHRQMRWERPPLAQTLRGWFFTFSPEPEPEAPASKARHNNR